ncbi:uncharacterized protein LACBIDRAFT_327483 [Laccaria bicolor S238N-H82]|uniref:Predicted protein n=1 Tax=Laccaria bicolor (strain S238N-H82 / ATCC MYA-4686) TaxID=486041 RepID=B0DBV2_LACBS|nr:uncharacterized protein LACBIDRAFT_327483 [Laccaria bicolor S238N-H82]EDR07779.1 predicted protein [Laccaria bicolor S238N-H82]|eukprot:XP_001881568.1 predicted protein [Laccaria bicolor S238N-H82]
MTSLYASVPNLCIDLSRWSCNTSTGSLFLTRTWKIVSKEGLNGETALLKPSSTLSVMFGVREPGISWALLEDAILATWLSASVRLATLDFLRKNKEMVRGISFPFFFGRMGLAKLKNNELNGVGEKGDENIKFSGALDQKLSSREDGRADGEDNVTHLSCAYLAGQSQARCTVRNIMILPLASKRPIPAYPDGSIERRSDSDSMCPQFHSLWCREFIVRRYSHPTSIPFGADIGPLAFGFLKHAYSPTHVENAKQRLGRTGALRL